MPRLTPRAIAYDSVQDRIVVLAQGKKKHLLQVDRAGNVEAVRAVPAPSETFWIAGTAQRFALFWSIGKLSLQPLPSGQGKSLKSQDNGTFARHVAFSSGDRWLGVEGSHVYGLRGDVLEIVDGTDIPGHVWLAAPDRGVVRRKIGGDPADWHRLVEEALPYLVSTTRIPEDDTFVVAEHSGRILFVSADGTCDEIKLSNVWCVEHHDGQLYAWSNNAVRRLDRDGTLTDTGITGETHNDNCLCATPLGLFFMEGSNLHRLDGGTWTTIELDATSLGIA